MRYVLLFVFAAGCWSGGDPLEGLAPAPDDHGPRIVWEPFGEGIPDIPFPNDVATRADASAPTGRRVNVTHAAKTRHERLLREKLDTLDGFGTFGPISVRFDARLDVLALHAAQTDGDRANDVVWLVGVTPGGRDYGRAVPLELGAGPSDQGRTRFPLTLEQPELYFPNDPRAASSNLLFETMAEDLDHDGVLDAGEDTDGDGVLDRPNTWGTALGEPFLDDGARDLLTFYELETDTLVVRPVLPLEQAQTYAVLLTRGLRGVDGAPVRSPFASVNHVQQNAALRPLVEDGVLAGLGLEVSDLAFAWTFTTQSITGDLAIVRAGLNGSGPLARLSAEFRPVLAKVEQVESEGANVYILATERLLEAIDNPLIGIALSLPAEVAEPVMQSFRDNVAYFVFAQLESPDLLAGDNRSFRMDAPAGAAQYERGTRDLLCTVPRPQPGRAQPYPVVVFSHGHRSSRLELIFFAGQLAAHGLATCAIDAYDHGLPDNPTFRELAATLLEPLRLHRLTDIVFRGRSKDLNGDGSSDAGGDFWGADVFHTRDAVRQTVIDTLQEIRVLRHFGVVTMPIDVNGDGADDLAGDFDGDGVHDLGGDAPFYSFGQSLGGITVTLVSALEPTIRAAAAVSAGGGLLDIALRTARPGVVESVYLPFMGPLVYGTPSETEGFTLAFGALGFTALGQARADALPFAQLADTVMPGDRAVLTNLANGEQRAVELDGDARFRLQIAADRGDPLRLELFRGSLAYRTVENLELDLAYHGVIYNAGSTLSALADGFGERRGTPSMRKLLSLAQTVLDPADPVNYAERLAPGAGGPAFLLALTLGDMNVPVSTGVALARAAGLVGMDTVDPRFGVTQDRELLDRWVVEGLDGLHRFAEDSCHYSETAGLYDVDETPPGALSDAAPSPGKLTLAPWCTNDPTECATCALRPALRATVVAGAKTHALRFLYMKDTGAHGFTEPDMRFADLRYQLNQIARFFLSDGRELSDDPCLAEATCPF